MIKRITQSGQYSYEVGKKDPAIPGTITRIAHEGTMYVLYYDDPVEGETWGMKLAEQFITRVEDEHGNLI